jgi:DNA-binding transcriptional MerR regulator
VALQLLAPVRMAQDFEQLLKDVFGEPLSKLSQYSTEQRQRLQTKLQELAREAIKDELAKLHHEIAELRARVAVLESERVQASADQV